MTNQVQLEGYGVRLRPVCLEDVQFIVALIPSRLKPYTMNRDEWDSLKHMQLAFAIEEEFCGQFTEEENPKLDSIASFAAHLSSRHAT
jgi:hypothetical protein